MTKLKEASKYLDERYYKNRGLEVADELDVHIRDLEQHDCWHGIASGVLQFSGDSLNDKFTALENGGLTYRVMGAKAESIQKIYRCVFEDLAEGKSLKEDDRLSENWLYTYSLPILGKMLEFIDKKDAEAVGEVRYSHIKPVDKIFKEYKTAKIAGRVNQLVEINKEELQKHIEDATELYNHINNKHPECFANSTINYQELLNLDISEFHIDRKSQELINNARYSGFIR